MRRLLTLAAIAVLPVAAQAADCAAPVTTLDMIDCASAEYDTADAALNAAYAPAMEVLRARGTEQALRDAQRAWVEFRDLACDAEALLFEGGSFQPVSRLSCLTRLTEARTADLKILAETN